MTENDILGAAMMGFLIAILVNFAWLVLTALGAPVYSRDWRKTGARLAHFLAGKLRQSAPVLGTPFRGSRLAQLAQTAIVSKNDDQDWRGETGATCLSSNPLIPHLDNVLRKEREMNDDTREGYADGIGNNYQQGRTKDYRSAWGEGRNDRAMLRHVETWRARNGVLAMAAQNG